MTFKPTSRREQIKGHLMIARQHLINAKRAELAGALESVRTEMTLAIHRAEDAIRAIDGPQVVDFMEYGPVD